MGKKIDYSQTELAQLTDSRDLAYLKANGARALPDSPTERGWSAAAIKRQLFMQPEILYAWLKKLAESQLALAQTIDSYLDALSKGKETPKVYPTLDDAKAAQASGAIVSGSLVFVAGDDVEVYLVGSDGSLSDIGLPLKETKDRIEAAESKVSVLETRADGADSEISALEARADRAESGISSLEQASEAHGEAIDAIEASSVSFNKRSLDGSVLADGLKTATEGSYSAIYARRSEQDAEGNPISATYATKKEVADSISSLEKRTFQVVDELPATGEEGVIYLMAVSSDPEDGYSQYIYENGGYIGLGTTKIDLSAYATIDLVNLKTKKFIFGPSSLKDVIIAAYEEEEFRDALGFADATDVGEDGKATYGKCVILTEELTRDTEGSVIGAEYSVVANGELYHAVLLENGGSYTVAISNPYVKKDDAVLAKALESISGVQQGIVGQYLKQTPAVLVGSDYAINLKLRESRNIYDIESASLPGITGDYVGNLEKANKGFTYDIISEKPVSGAAWVTITLRYADYGLSDGDNIMVSLDFACSNPDFTAQLIYNYYNTDTYDSTSGDSATVKSGNRASVSIPIKTNGGAYNSLRLVLSTVYNASYPAGTTLSFNNIQIEKGSTAHPYDEYGTYSKGSVVQYAGKNIINLPGTSEMGETKAAMFGNTPVTINRDYSNFFINLKEGGVITSGSYSGDDEQYHKFVKSHKYLIALGKGDSDGVWSDVGSPLNIALLEQGNNTSILSGVQAPYRSPDDKWTLNATRCVYENANPAFIFLNGGSIAIDSFPISAAVVIDLTAAGDDYLTTEEAYEKYSASLATLASGASIANSKRTSPLIKNFGTGLYLTKPEGYSLIISEFSDMPPALNQSVDFDDLTFFAQTKYSSSGKVTLQPTTQSIIYMVEKDGGGVISDGDLALWQSSSQLEYGDYATEITAYIAPKVLGAFDYLEGNAKSIITKVGEGDNVHVGFIPDEGYLGIDYANSTDDLSQSYVAYRTIDLATQVANNTDEIEEIKSGLGVKDGEVTEAKIADGAVALSKLASDTKEYIEERARFLSLGDARFLKQSVVPKLRSYELSIAASALKGKFGLGSYAPQGTEHCFIYYGDDPSPMTLATVSLGDDGNWVVKPSQTLASGTEVSCGDLLYKVTQGICKAGVFLTNIWDCVKPIGCRFEYYASGPSLVCQNMRFVDVTFKPNHREAQTAYTLIIRNCRDMSVYCDEKGTNGYCQYNGYGLNSNMVPFPVLAIKGWERPLPNDKKAVQMLMNARIGNTEKTTSEIAFPMLEYAKWVLSLQEEPRDDQASNYAYISDLFASGEDVENTRVVQGDGKTGLLRFNPIFDVAPTGTVRLDGYAYYDPYTPPEATPTKARAMSMQAEPVEPNVPEGAVGIFSIDGDGNTINAMTGEVVG